MNEVAQQIEEYVPALQRYALSLCRNATAADDLVQECVVRGLTKAHLYKPGTNLRAWLFTIMRNRFISECRKPKPVAGSHEIDSGQYDVGIPGAQQDTVEPK